MTTIPYSLDDCDPPDDGRPMVLNQPSAEGTLMGRRLARLTDAQEPAYRAANPGAPRRCGECAFRRGTVPNRCSPTVAAAVMCAVEGEEFSCHEIAPEGNAYVARGPCAGWLILNGKVGLPAEEARGEAIPLPPMGSEGGA